MYAFYTPISRKVLRGTVRSPLQGSGLNPAWLTQYQNLLFYNCFFFFYSEVPDESWNLPLICDALLALSRDSSPRSNRQALLGDQLENRLETDNPQPALKFCPAKGVLSFFFFQNFFTTRDDFFNFPFRIPLQAEGISFRLLLLTFLHRWRQADLQKLLSHPFLHPHQLNSDFLWHRNAAYNPSERCAGEGEGMETSLTVLQGDTLEANIWHCSPGML